MLGWQDRSCWLVSRGAADGMSPTPPSSRRRADCLRLAANLMTINLLAVYGVNFSLLFDFVFRVIQRLIFFVVNRLQL